MVSKLLRPFVFIVSASRLPLIFNVDAWENGLFSAMLLDFNPHMEVIQLPETENLQTMREIIGLEAMKKEKE